MVGLNWFWVHCWSLKLNAFFLTSNSMIVVFALRKVKETWMAWLLKCLAGLRLAANSFGLKLRLVPSRRCCLQVMRSRLVFSLHQHFEKCQCLWETPWKKSAFAAEFWIGGNYFLPLLCQCLILALQIRSSFPWMKRFQPNCLHQNAC